MKKKDKTMYKNSLVKGAFITTLGIIITKVIGILYVIPFHAIIGEKGGALYGYAYTIYLIFLSISTAGVPLAISKIVSEYQTLGYINIKNRVFFLGKRLALVLGIICFILLIVFAPFIAQLVLGDLTGGNTLEDVTYVIRIISFAILIVPLLSVYRGYFEGHRIMSPPSISQIIEQIVRVLVIVIGSYLFLKVFKLGLTNSVGIAVFGATVGAICAYLYLSIKRLKNKSKFDNIPDRSNEPIIKDKVLLKKIVIYAVPFIMIDVFKNLFSYIDMITVVKGLVNYAKFSVVDAESIMSMLSTWSAKFNMILLSISTGVIVSLIPNLTKSLVDKNKDEISIKINQSLNVMLYFMIPMSIGISFLARPIWNLFYGSSLYGPSVLTLYIFVGLFSGLFTALVTIIQVLKDYKVVAITLGSSLVLKVILNLILIQSFYNIGLPAYYGVITSSLLSYLFGIILSLLVLRIKYKVSFEETFKNFFDIMFAVVFMWLLLFGLKLFIPISVSSRLVSLLLILLFSLVGGFLYLYITYKLGTTTYVFGNKIDKLFSKLKRKKKTAK